jgi:hypothetical protein
MMVLHAWILDLYATTRSRRIADLKHVVYGLQYSPDGQYRACVTNGGYREAIFRNNLMRLKQALRLHPISKSPAHFKHSEPPHGKVEPGL